ncbi:MAG: PQQ-binding-like beta-propeller repeat protein [Pirellulales bacterium]|nr:PQQ-binding-like beta-propeller repeat protein [Pirellulales bacterium]
MKNHLPKSILLLAAAKFVFIACYPVVVHGQDAWPQFRGPGGQGHAEVDLAPLTWSETQNVAWKTKIPGQGYSSPVIGGNRVWLTTATNQGHSLRAVCVDRTSGDIIKDLEVFAPAEPPRVNATNSYASPTPVLQGNRLWVCYGTMGTACLNIETGEVLWRNNQLTLDHKEGPGSSPMIVDDLLVINCDGQDVRYVAALNKETGELVWKTDRSVPPSRNPDMNKAYSTPLVISANGRRELISPGAMHVAAYNPETGDELWKVLYPQGFSNVPRPVFGDGLLFISTGYTRATLLAIRPSGDSDVTDTHVAWSSNKQAPTRPSPLYLDGRLYVVSDRGVLTCFQAATGETIYTERLGGSFAASPIFAGGHIYFCDEDGVTSVVKPGDEFKRVAQNKLSAPFKASPAATGKEIYLRTTEALYRIEEQE